MLNPEEAAQLGGDVVQMPKPLEERIAFRAAQLVDYQGKRLAKRYRKLVDGIEDARLREAVAVGYHKLLAYKDEYEVARLHLQTEAKAREVFEGDLKLSYHLAPPLLPGRDPSGRPRKRQFGAWMGRGFRVLAKLRKLRGTPLDPFGYTAERRMERGLIRQYESDMAGILRDVRPETLDIAVEIANLPRQIRGYGPVKEAHVAAAAKRREELFAAFRAGGAPLATAAE